MSLGNFDRNGEVQISSGRSLLLRIVLLDALSDVTKKYLQLMFRSLWMTSRYS